MLTLLLRREDSFAVALFPVTESARPNSTKLTYVEWREVKQPERQFSHIGWDGIAILNFEYLPELSFLQESDKYAPFVK